MTPTLPEPALNHGTFAPCNRYEGSVSKAYTEDQLVEYGKACREAALEEAAGVCIAVAIAPSNCILGAAMNCADAIRKLK